MSRAWAFILFIGFSGSVSLASQCMTRGRFPNNAETDCRGFTNCIPIGEGLFYEYNVPCPTTFIFNHIDNQCTNASTYQCYPGYTCIAVGNFENKDIKDCSSYIACVKGLTEIVTARLIQCPNNMVFSPTASACVDTSSYDCNPVTVPPAVDKDKNIDANKLPDNVTVSINNINVAFGIFGNLALVIALCLISLYF